MQDYQLKIDNLKIEVVNVEKKHIIINLLEKKGNKIYLLFL